MDLVVYYPLISAAVAAGTAYGVLRVKQAATQSRLNQVETTIERKDEKFERKIRDVDEKLAEHSDRLARIETKIDVLLNGRR